MKKTNKNQIPDSRFQILNLGFTLIEMLVVISIFAILGILITRSVLLTLGGAKKSESLVNVRENLNYSVGVIERQLRNANSIIDCTNENTSVISYTDQLGNPASFSCNEVGVAGQVGYIASGSSQLSGSGVNITGCTFTCKVNAGSPSSISVDLSAKDASASGVENSVVTSSTQIQLRNY
jgi:prepilin-type N-terminal cleavage/methylation domain-containing protein